MKHENNFKKLMIIAIVIAIVAVTLGYAGLSQVLNITTSGTVQSQATSWNVAFNGECTCTASANATNGTCSLAGTTVTISSIVLKAPGASVSCTFNVKNSGAVNAKLSAVDPITATYSGASADINTVKSNYNYSIVYTDNSTAPKANDVLNSNTSKTLKVTVTYNSGATSLPGANVTISSLGTKLTYVQA